MRRLFPIVVITGLLVAMASVAWAATNLNSSRSNIYRLVYTTDGMTPAQAAALGAKLDKLGGADEAAVRGILTKLGVKIGCGKGCINHIKVLKGNTILVLENAADEPQALAVTVKGSNQTQTIGSTQSGASSIKIVMSRRSAEWLTSLRPYGI